MNITELQHELQHNILPFWSEQMVDYQNDGFYGQIDGNNRLIPSADKGIILNSRILWTFSAAYRLYPTAEYLQLAERAYSYIRKFFLDTTHGGVYWMLDSLGNPVEKKKQTYAQAFTIYGLSEFSRISQSEEPLQLAQSLYFLMEKHAFDPKKNGYLEAFSVDWKSLEDVRLSVKDMNADKTMNTHLHVLEAYTNLYRVWKNDDLKKSLHNLVQLMINKFISSSGHFHLFYTKDWQLLSDNVSFGHDIEGSWLLHDAAMELGEQDLLSTVENLVPTMVAAALEGMDDEGGLMNEGTMDRVVDTDKHWWPQAEALIGLANAYQMTGNNEYLRGIEKTWTYIQNHLIDREAGEWHWKVSRDGIVDRKEDKAGPWKCPYHNGRAMIELLTRLK